MITPLIFTASILLQSPYTIDYLEEPAGEVLEVGGIDFFSNGDMVVSTRRGQVWRIQKPESVNPQDAVFTLICEGLHEGLGLAVRKDELYVMQRGEISRLIDLDGDLIIDEIQTITQDWGMSGNYHEFGFGLPVDDEGNMYFSLNLGFWNPHWWHGKSRAPYRGWVLKLTPKGEVVPIAGGLRSPAGLGLLEDGTLLVTDNQGDWMAVCPVYAIKEGAFYGHPASLRWYEDQPDIEPSDTQPHPEVAREHPALWLPYQWSRSTGNVIQDKTGGPFNGQYFIAELTNGQILRAQFEEIDGILQGACWLAHQRVGSSYHIKFGPDGTLYSGMTNRGWGGLAPGNGIARIKFDGTVPFEMQGAHLTKNGFEIIFTKPLTSAPLIEGTKYDYNYWWEYGSPQQNIESLIISEVSLSTDGKKANVTIDNLEAGKCVMLTLSDAHSTDGETLRHNQVSYTINKMPGGSLEYVAKEVMPPIERGERVEGWLYLNWADAFDMWMNNGVELCNAELDIKDNTKFKLSEGMSALVASEGESMETTFNSDSGEVKFAYMLAENSSANITLPNQMTYELKSIGQDGYLGAGIWHNAQFTFKNEPQMIEKVEINGVVSGKDIYGEDKAKQSTLKIATSKGELAFADVRIRQFQEDSLPAIWAPLKYNSNTIESTDGVQWEVTDGGDFVCRGTGTVTIPYESTFKSIRFDTKVNGTGLGTITIGQAVFDVATQGTRKTGGTQDHPIQANLIDQNEWCTVMLEEGNWVDVLLNQIPIYKAKNIQFNEQVMQIHVENVELSLRRVFIK